VLSGDDDDETVNACIDAGADLVMQKPAPVSELRRRLDEAVRMLQAA
jgi:DNA-binding NarL/FixJ family response regulator